MKCPKCGSENCQRLEVVYDGGTQNIDTKSHTVGVGIGGGGLGAGGATTTTSGTSRSRLAEKASPPEKAPWDGAIGIIFMMIIFISMTSSIMWQITWMAILAFCVFWIYKAVKFNSRVWPGLYAEWKNKWLCHKCGDIYEDVS